MQMTSKEPKKITNIIRNFYLFVILIGFVTSTLDKISENPNSNRDILEKKNLVDLNNIYKPKNFFS